MYKKLRNLIIAAAISLGVAGCNCNSGCKTEGDSKGEIQPIKVFAPERPAGQKDVVGLVTPKLETVRVGFIGLGMRGPSAVKRFTHIPGTKITALCDVVPERVEKTQKILDEAQVPRAAEYSGSLDAWKGLCERDDVDLVYIVTDWKHHVPMALYAMEHGKHVAIEVPGAMSLEDIWALINKAEEKQLHCMMLENCVYDFFELTTLNMAQKGLFGEVIHAEGAYIHSLEDFWGAYWENWRLEYNRENRGDVYPTHGIGPACQALNIHRGDKMNYLVSIDTKPFNGPKYYKKLTGKEAPDFQNGDHTMTLIKTEKGKTMQIQHNVMTPRPYSRMYQLTGTEGFANKYPIEGFTLRPENVSADEVPNHENLNAHGFVSAEIKKALMEKYKHPIHKELEEQAKKVGGHGGMDFIMDYRLIYCLQNGLPLDMDVYDLAEWSCLVPLSKISLENGSAPVEIPDFTRGAWNKVQKYEHAFAK
ncbi:Gfo/Idh/MocA family protein [Capnocytophaga canimorsus]|uniref:Gfo/Idh/MocA family protein n=1 Tax=Capnocytophaga canimorsus TaxID=28188 RepID=UPI000D6E13EA|nr:Gfo/Idh/MocA family oxidoreductase [Capnocytophaga canimorsus]AWL79260.1 glycosyl hydrolase [Capnocytophaga canimorsus]AYW37858.1 gfo/Idh/MocA family oxidoreductase [Capnocytophaga canimorsus]MDT9498708.1 Gfo/Idh/MocA family oxidoreductase [Capnocytophaga canimorsus]GIM58639.1 glycosyl hydrolase family 109 protein 1 [Capnocytophaga canimorsus]